jgi:hypothetical protein
MAIRPRPVGGAEEQRPVRVAPAPAPPEAPIAVNLRTDVARAVRSPNALRPVSIGLPPSLYEDYLTYAASQGSPLASILRKILTEGLPAAIGGGGRPAGPAQGLGGVARRRT